jgi:predicted component of type VI protein secretion system
MSKPVPRSRLNISYRTKIDGKPKKARLPMRFLVLGDFTGANQSLLGERPLHSILPGMKLASFMEELRVTAPIEEKALQERLKGALKGTVTGVLVGEPEAAATEARVKIRGRAVVQGDVRANQLGSFVGEVEVSGEVMLPYAGGELAIPDGGSVVKLAIHGKVEPPPGAEIGLTGDVRGEYEVKIGPRDGGEGPDGGFKGPVSAEAVQVDLTIPLRSINDFKPLHVAMSVPEIRRIVLLHRLTLEARNHISSFPELREAMKAELVQLRDVKPADGEKSPIGRLRSYFRGKYPLLVADARPAAAPAADAPAPELDADARGLLERLISSAGMNPAENKQRALVERPGSDNIAFHDRDTSFTLADRFANILAVLLVNIDVFAEGRRVDSIRTLMLAIDALLLELDALVQKRLAGVVQSPSLRALEVSWRSLRRPVPRGRVERGDHRLPRHRTRRCWARIFRTTRLHPQQRAVSQGLHRRVRPLRRAALRRDDRALRVRQRRRGHRLARDHVEDLPRRPTARSSPRSSRSSSAVDSWEDLERKDDLEELLGLPQFGRWAAFRDTITGPRTSA